MGVSGGRGGEERRVWGAIVAGWLVGVMGMYVDTGEMVNSMDMWVEAGVGCDERRVGRGEFGGQSLVSGGQRYDGAVVRSSGKCVVGGNVGQSGGGLVLVQYISRSVQVQGVLYVDQQ